MHTHKTEQACSGCVQAGVCLIKWRGCVYACMRALMRVCTHRLHTYKTEHECMWVCACTCKQAYVRSSGEGVRVCSHTHAGQEHAYVHTQTEHACVCECASRRASRRVFDQERVCLCALVHTQAAHTQNRACVYVGVQACECVQAGVIDHPLT